MQSMNDVGEAADLEVQAEEQELELKELEKAADEAPIVKLVNLILTEAVKRGASDIHMEPYEKEYRVRFRMDGVLQSIMKPPLKAEGRHHFAPEDHGQARHQRKASAAGRPHHAEDADRRQEEAARLPRQRLCRRCGAKRSCFACSTRKTSAST